MLFIRAITLSMSSLPQRWGLSHLSSISDSLANKFFMWMTWVQIPYMKGITSSRGPQTRPLTLPALPVEVALDKSVCQIHKHHCVWYVRQRTPWLDAKKMSLLSNDLMKIEFDLCSYHCLGIKQVGLTGMRYTSTASVFCGFKMLLPYNAVLASHAHLIYFYNTDYLSMVHSHYQLKCVPTSFNRSSLITKTGKKRKRHVSIVFKLQSLSLINL